LSLLRKLLRYAIIIFDFAYSIAEVVLVRPKTRAARSAWLGKLCCRVARTIDFTWSIVGPIPMEGAVITNHLSYLDIFFHSAMRPCVFVSKAELRQTPVLGWISMMAGTVYVSRGTGGSAAKAAEGMAQGFRDGLPVVFFPEGTTGIGDVPALEFRSGLLAQALAAEVPVRAGFIHYELTPRDLAAGRTTRNDIHWGTQTLAAHVWNLLGLHGIHATIRFAESPIDFSEAALHNRKIAAVEARDAVVALSVPLQSPIGRQ
jgi:1-acyl-sn-glycerol-3-phosphate acyltransferase